MLNMYEIINITKTLLQVLQPQIAQRYESNYVLMCYYSPSPRYKGDHVLSKRPYVLSRGYC